MGLFTSWIPIIVVGLLTVIFVIVIRPRVLRWQAKKLEQNILEDKIKYKNKKWYEMISFSYGLGAIDFDIESKEFVRLIRYIKRKLRN
jgi:hypothetical protein